MASETIAFGGPASKSLSFNRSINPIRAWLNFKTIVPLLKLRLRISAAKRNPKRLKYSAPRFTKGDGFVYVEVDPSGDDSWKLEPVVKLLREGAVGVIPTDTVYAIVCDLKSHSAIERLRRIKEIEASKASLSMALLFSLECIRRCLNIIFCHER
ncbi:hypothetical protein GIB67_009343 [Kingdonia uniflora]|uniref:Threonylcarbamoyl-AMP synthase n=1 Tax=Kingdonia uniflora TaxID=39325 RepID=A0A7J7N330_9MAGN|nr:hypothetical protein GIB67_009343 [Kingdonia uniflora]